MGEGRGGEGVRFPMPHHEATTGAVSSKDVTVVINRPTPTVTCHSHLQMPLLYQQTYTQSDLTLTPTGATVVSTDLHPL